MKSKVAFLAVATSLVLLAGCKTGEVPQQTSSSHEASSNSSSSSMAESEPAATNSDTDEVLLENASMDFTALLGFKVDTWVGPDPIETKIIGDQVAEIKWEKDMTSTAYLRIASSVVQNIMPSLDGAFEAEYTESIGNITVNLGHSVGGPMYASWEKDGLQFCYYQKKGEASAAKEAFAGNVSYYVNDIVLVK